MKYAIIFEKALSEAHVVGPFATKEEADAYAKAHHEFPQIWRIAIFEQITPAPPPPGQT